MQKMQNGHVFMTNKEIAQQLGFADSNTGNYGLFFVPKPAVEKAIKVVAPKIGAASSFMSNHAKEFRRKKCDEIRNSNLEELIM